MRNNAAGDAPSALRASAAPEDGSALRAPLRPGDGAGPRPGSAWPAGRSALGLSGIVDVATKTPKPKTKAAHHTQKRTQLFTLRR
jgi:hypothetical protein